MSILGLIKRLWRKRPALIPEHAVSATTSLQDQAKKSPLTPGPFPKWKPGTVLQSVDGRHSYKVGENGEWRRQ